MNILDYAKLVENKDFRVTPEGVETTNSRATGKLNSFIRSAEKVWKTLSAQVRFWRMKRLSVKLQALLRSYLAQRRDERVTEAVASLRGLVALLGSVQMTLGPKRRATVRIQSFFRMLRTRKFYLNLIEQKTRRLAATRIQKIFRGWYARLRTGPALAKHRMLLAIKIMQACIRRVLCTKIMYLSALKRQRQEAALRIQRFFRFVVFRSKLREIRGLKFLAVRAKFIAYILAHAQLRIAKNVRGFLVRKRHVYHVARIRVVREQGKVSRIRHQAATKIRNFWKSWVIRKQYLYVRRLTLALQMRLRTSLARRDFIGPRLPAPRIR